MAEQEGKIRRNFKRKRICKIEDEEYDFDMNQYLTPKKENTSIQVQLAAEDKNVSLIKCNKKYVSSTTITTINNDSMYNDYTGHSSSQFMEQLNCNYQLVILKQPEETHRARYLSEGSRGSIKDRSGFSHCTIQLVGYYRPTRVEIYAATGDGPIKPHSNYDLIQVLGKTANTLPSKRIRSHDGITCIEIILRPENNMTAVLDCIGILKICSYDMKKRNAQKGNGKVMVPQQHPQMSGSNAVRLVFRAYIDKGSINSMTVIQTESEPILCVQQLGIPEISKISLTHAPAHGGMDLFIIGRNFDRSVSVIFREYKENGSLAWSAEGTIQKQYLHQCHIVCTVPAFHNIFEGGSVSITVRCGSKMSHPYSFYYTPTTDGSGNHSSSKESSTTTIKYHSSPDIDNRSINNLSVISHPQFLNHTTSYYNNNHNDNNTKIDCIDKKGYEMMGGNFYATNNTEQRYEVSENESYEPSPYNHTTSSQPSGYSNPMWMVENSNYENIKQTPHYGPTPTLPDTNNFLTNTSSLYLNYHTMLQTPQYKEAGEISFNNSDFFLNSPSVIESPTPTIKGGSNNMLLDFVDSTQETDFILDTI
uniref:RHD domain-containing protein n=1 Tax=Strongyloides papillosus TaxID=174720 RepID=A0A0N5BN09_STREA